MNTVEINSKMDELLDMTRTAFHTFTEQTERALRAERPTLLAVDEDTAPPADLALDVALVRAAPVAVVPTYCAFQPLTENGHRFLLARGGLYLEVRRPWLYLVHRLAEQPHVHVPYGDIATTVDFTFGRLGSALPQLQQFAQQAREHSPLETAASVVWRADTGQWDLRIPEVIGEATASHIRYRQVDLAEHESLVIDLHSHGAMGAFFSDTDDADDQGAVKIAGVYGCLETAAPTLLFRLCVLGLHLPLAVPADKVFGTGGTS